MVFVFDDEEQSADRSPPDLRLSQDEYLRWWREAGERELRQLLLWRWDPIGVADAFPSTEDEYDDHAGAVIKALRSGEGKPGVLRTLLQVEREMMDGPLSSDQHLDYAAGLIVDWFENSTQRWRDRRSPLSGRG